MNRNDVRGHKSAQMGKRIKPTLDYLSRLRKRMEEVDFQANDSLYAKVVEAGRAMQNLSIELAILAEPRTHDRRRDLR